MPAPRRLRVDPTERAIIANQRMGHGTLSGRSQAAARVYTKPVGTGAQFGRSGFLKATYHSDVVNLAPNTSGNLVLVKDSGDDIFDVGTYECLNPGFINVDVWVKNSGVEAGALGTQMYFADPTFTDDVLISWEMTCGLFPGLVDQSGAHLAYVVQTGYTFVPSYFRGADGQPNFPSSNWQFIVSQIVG
jgi:hypothetical protein